MKKNPKEFCSFCGPRNECDAKNHTKEFLQDLLLDAGICFNKTEVNLWWNSISRPWPEIGAGCKYTAALLWSSGNEKPLGKGIWRIIT